jgi:hypothetical protein
MTEYRTESLHGWLLDTATAAPMLCIEMRNPSFVVLRLHVQRNQEPVQWISSHGCGPNHACGGFL